MLTPADTAVAHHLRMPSAPVLTSRALNRALLARQHLLARASMPAEAVRYLVPMVQVPPRGLWQTSGQPIWRSLESWLGRPVEGDDAPDRLVLRYLAAFGPASVKDIATWSWLTRVREIIDRLRSSLRVYRDERGGELFDVEDGALPDPETPAPARFLPEYDNIALSHSDRGRIIDPRTVGRITGYVGTFLGDGLIAGQWRLDGA